MRPITLAREAARLRYRVNAAQARQKSSEQINRELREWRERIAKLHGVTNGQK